MIFLIKNCLEGGESKQILILTIKFWYILLISLLLYAIITKLIITMSGITLSDYEGISTMGRYTIHGIINGIIKTYKHIFIPVYSVNAIAPNAILRVIYIIFILLDVIYIIIGALKNKRGKINLCFAIFFMLLLPISFNSIYILNNSESMEYHCLMMFSYCFIYIILIYIIEKYNKYLNRIIKLLIVVQIFSYAYIANMAYFKLYLAYENTYSFYTSIITRIENVIGYNKDTKIALIGKYDSKELFTTDEFDVINELTGVANNSQLINSYTRLDFIKYYIGFNGKFINKFDTLYEIINTDTYKEMPIYPYEGSIKMINNIVVVKLW